MKQKSILQIFRSNIDENSVETVELEDNNNNLENPQEEQEEVEMRSEHEDETASESDNSEPEEASGKSDTPNLLEVYQTQEKWELRFPFAYYSASKKGWLCHLCSEYGEGDEYWRSVGVKLHAHPTDTFKRQMEGKKHIDAKKKKQELKNLLSKGRIYKQLIDGERQQSRNVKKRNRRVIKKFLKATYFLARKKWAVRENFRDVIDFLRDLGDQDIDEHLRECSSRATYTSVKSADEFLECLSKHLEDEFINRLIAAYDFTLMADETSDMGDRCELAIFVRYIDSDLHEIKEEFLGMVEVVGSKGAEALCMKICNVLQEKGINIENMRFNGMDGTNTMSGETSGLQRRFRHITPHSKYMNCRNHKLALVFVHLLEQYEALKAVDTSVVSVWKLMKYSSVKSAVFGEAQSAEGLQNLKLLKAAPTRWLHMGMPQSVWFQDSNP